MLRFFWYGYGIVNISRVLICFLEIVFMYLWDFFILIIFIFMDLFGRCISFIVCFYFFGESWFYIFIKIFFFCYVVINFNDIVYYFVYCFFWFFSLCCINYRWIYCVFFCLILNCSLRFLIFKKFWYNYRWYVYVFKVLVGWF